MALRRPPTRIELKADDIEEYDQLMKERELAMQDDSSDALSGGRHGGNRPRGAKPGTSAQRKQVAAERIGATGTHRR
ncbi:unnamed protein product [Cylindrotheca closterium]|uniref:Anaphase-promoting complex subunit CDC26 n=1 Tax=Cylindrotheca closterium TaxID=2856 RepID=A0AAD2JIT4_9STRA|nr:unnamed protein product [Cylindrotheca closterium]